MISGSLMGTRSTYLGEIPLNELIRLLLQHFATVLLGKTGDPDGIRGVQLSLQESTARIHDIRHLEHCGGW